MCRKMRRLKAVKLIPVNITHGAGIGKDKSPWDNQQLKTVYVSSSAVEEDEDLDIREENDDYHEDICDKKNSFIRQIVFIFTLLTAQIAKY